VDIVGVAEVVSAVAVLIGFGFAVSEMRRYRRRKERESMLELVKSYQTLEFAVALNRIVDLPDRLSKQQLENHLGEDMRFISLLMTTWEALGVLIHRREMDLGVVEDFFSGPILLSWKKLRRFVEEMRRIGGRETYYEWFQWLAERLEERESKVPPIPAHLEHKDWRA
jgi:hypothetical protein